MSTPLIIDFGPSSDAQFRDVYGRHQVQVGHVASASGNVIRKTYHHVSGASANTSAAEVVSLDGSNNAQYDLLMRDGDAVWIDRQPLVYIYGEVQRPGVLRLERGMTLMQALAAGGGPSARGTDKGIVVHRRAEDGRVRVLQPRMDEPVRDGDVVYVRESLF